MTIQEMAQRFLYFVNSAKRQFSATSVLAMIASSARHAVVSISNNWIKPCGRHHSAIAFILFFIGVCLPLLQGELLLEKILQPDFVHVAAFLLICLLLIVFLFARSWMWLPSFICIGLFWSSYAFTNQLTDFLPTIYERVSIQIQGQIVSLPEYKHGNANFLFEIEQVVGSEELKADLAVLKKQRVRLSCYRCPHQFEPNQRWHVTVRLKRPHGYASWGAFDYEKYLFRHRIIATGYLRTKDTNKLLMPSKQEINIYNSNMVNVLTSSFNEWRWRIKQNIADILPDSSIGRNIILALAIGDKAGLTSEQRGVLQTSGTSHLMAISGLHVGLVFLALMWFLSWLLKPFAKLFEWCPCQYIVLLPCLVGAFFYAGLAGFAVSTQRAFTMLSVYVICRFIGLTPSLLKVLLISVVIVLMIDPNSILDIGFWLSCGAVLIIALLSLPSKKYTESETHRNTQALSLLKLQPALWLGMLPMVMVFFGEISLVSPLVNLIAVPMFCLLLIPLTLSAVLLNELGFRLLAAPLLNLLQKLFDWVFEVLQWVSELAFSSWASGPVSHWVLLACSGVVFVHLCNWRWRYWSWLLIAAAAFLPSHKPIQDKLIVTLLDVGQGLAMVIEQSDYTLVYDTGPRYQSGFSTAQAVLIPYLNYRGIRHLDALVVSHADNDHIGGYEHLMSVFPAREVLTSRIDKLPQAKACNAGYSWSQGLVGYQFISPDINTPDGSNNRSCVLRISYGNTVLLITGDIEKSVEKYLLEGNADLAADIVLVPHQGSKTSSTAQFIDAVAPDLALIAAGYLNHYGHPHPEVTSRYRQRGVAMASTIDSGSIQIEISASDWRIKTYRETRKRFWQHRKVPKSTG